MRNGPARSCWCRRRGTNPLEHLGPADARDRSEFALRGVRFFRHLLQQREELRLLPDEQAIRGERCYRRHGASKSVVARSNHRAVRQVRADELARNRKNQAGLNSAGRLQWWVVEEIGERQTGYRILKRRHRLLHAVACEIHPFEEGGNSISPNAQRDLQHFQTAYLLTKRPIEARATLFDVSEVKSPYVSDRLDVVVTLKVGIRSAIEILVVAGNGGDVVEFERLRKRGAKIGIGGTAVPHQPAGVHV